MREGGECSWGEAARQPQIIKGEKILVTTEGWKLFRYQFTLMNKTLINPLNLLHEIIPVYTSVHCTEPGLNNKKSGGKKKENIYLYIFKDRDINVCE